MPVDQNQRMEVRVKRDLSLSVILLFVLAISVLASGSPHALEETSAHMDSIPPTFVVVERLPQIEATAVAQNNVLFLYEKVHFAAEHPTNSGNSGLQYLWDLDGDSVIDREGARIYSDSLTLLSGEYEICLLVQDSNSTKQISVQTLELSVLPYTFAEAQSASATKRTYDFFATGLLWILAVLVMAGLMSMEISHLPIN